ncbi:MAG: class I SAM-dependent methyltransferase [Gemmatimonadales bacterium]
MTESTPSPAPAYGAIDHYLGERGARYFGWQGEPGILQGHWNRHLWESYVRRSDDVLDFGCGGGFLLHVLDARTKTGVEINPHAAQSARGLGITTYGTLAEVPGVFDRVITSHVLEHIPHPRQAVLELRSKLRDEESRLVILLPLDDWRNRANRDFRAADRNMHLQAWTPQTLGNLLTSAGLTVLEVRILREAWPPRPELLWRISPRLFRLASRVWAVVSQRYQLLAVCRLPVEGEAAR